ncbi:MAG: 50S ribosomal protein L20 [Verrucomicrobia bacterium]|nr:50S ribosomal protein L20 [Verrucomicrobiota bacterium]
MVRVTNAVAYNRRRKRLFKRAKGFSGDRKNHLRQTDSTVMRAMAFHYRHRKHNKRNFRRLWITRIGIAARMNGLSYSRLIDGMRKADCIVDRKMLSALAVHDLVAFRAVADVAKAALVS